MAQLTFPTPTITGGNTNNSGGGTAFDTMPVLSTVTFVPSQSRIPASFVIPAIGQTVTVTITPIATPTPTAFQVGDLVVVDRTQNGVSLERATFIVDAVLTNSLSLRFQPVAGDAAAGATLTANCEITGQTRLPNIPATATYARVSVIDSNALQSAAVNQANPLNQVATNLMSGEALAYLGFAVAGTPQIDLITQRGEHLGYTGYTEIGNRQDLLNARLFSAAPLAIAPNYFVTYK